MDDNYLLRRYYGTKGIIKGSKETNRHDTETICRIPYRTLEDWERGVRHIAEYLLRLMIYRLEMEGLARGLSEKMPD